MTLEGLNVAGALARLGIGFDALQRMLIRFADGQSKTVADLRASVTAGDADAAARHAHAIAGAAGSLGADTLRESARALEMAARGGGGDLPALAQRVEELAAVVFRSIATLRPSGEAPAAAAPAAAVDAAGVRQALVALRDALAAGDPDASASALAALAAMPLHDEVRASVARAPALADEYRFDEAEEIIRSLLTHGAS